MLKYAGEMSRRLQVNSIPLQWKFILHPIILNQESTYVDASNNNADSNEYVEYFSFPSKPTWFIAGLPAEHEMVGELRVRKAHVKKLKHYEKILKASMMLSTLDMVDSPEFYIDAEEAN